MGMDRIEVVPYVLLGEIITIILSAKVLEECAARE